MRNSILMAGALLAVSLAAATEDPAQHWEKAIAAFETHIMQRY